MLFRSGIDDLIDKLLEHRSYLEGTRKLEERRNRNTRLELIKLVEEELFDMIISKAQEEDVLDELSSKVVTRQIDPYTAKDSIIKLFKK